MFASDASIAEYVHHLLLERLKLLVQPGCLSLRNPPNREQFLSARRTLRFKLQQFAEQGAKLVARFPPSALVFGQRADDDLPRGECPIVELARERGKSSSGNRRAQKDAKHFVFGFLEPAGKLDFLVHAGNLKAPGIFEVGCQRIEVGQMDIAT